MVNFLHCGADARIVLSRLTGGEDYRAVAEKSNDARMRALHAATLGEYAPAKIVQLLDLARDAVRIAEQSCPMNGAPRVYVCTESKCLAPVSEARGAAEGIKEIAK